MKSPKTRFRETFGRSSLYFEYFEYFEIQKIQKPQRHLAPAPRPQCRSWPQCHGPSATAPAPRPQCHLAPAPRPQCRSWPQCHLAPAPRPQCRSWPQCHLALVGPSAMAPVPFRSIGPSATWPQRHGPSAALGPSALWLWLALAPRPQRRSDRLALAPLRFGWP